MTTQITCTCPAYPFPHREYSGKCEAIDPDEECEHGYLLNDGCPYCEKEQWGCDRYHALKDDGYYG